MAANVVGQFTSAIERDQMSFSVKLKGFTTKDQAIEFLRWYEGGGEQYFYDHLSIVGKNPKDGCNIVCSHKGNSGRYWDENNGEISAFVNKMRDLAKVIEELLQVIPLDKDDFRADLKSCHQIALFSAPELMYLRWESAAEILAEYMDLDETKHNDWEKKVIDIWLNKEQ